MNGREAGRGALALLSGQWLKYLVQIASLVVLARLLTPSDYGLMAMAMAIVGLANVFGDFGLSLAAVQAKVLSQGQKSNLFWLNSAIGFVTGLVIALASPAIAWLYDDDRLVGLCVLLAAAFPLNGIAVQFRTELNRNRQFKWLALTEVSGQLAGFVLAVFAALAGLGYWSLGIQLVAASFFGLIIAFVGTRWRPGPPSRGQSMSSLLRFGANTFGVQFVNYASSNIDSVLIGRELGAAVLGLYNRAFQLMSLPLQQLASPLTRIVMPYLSRLSTGESFQSAANRVQVVLGYGLIGVLSLLAGTSEPFLAVVLGPEWATAWPILEILALGGLFQALGYVYYWIFLARARTGLLFWSELFGRSIMVALMFLWVQDGPEFVALASAIGLFLIWLVATTVTVPRLGVRTTPIVITALRPTVLFLAVFILCRIIRAFSFDVPAVVELIILIAVWLVSTCALVLAITPFRRDLLQIIELANRVLRRKGGSE